MHQFDVSGNINILFLISFLVVLVEESQTHVNNHFRFLIERKYLFEFSTENLVVLQRKCERNQFIYDGLRGTNLSALKHHDIAEQFFYAIWLVKQSCFKISSHLFLCFTKWSICRYPSMGIIE